MLPFQEMPSCHCEIGRVCEQHPDRGWPHDDCPGPGIRCQNPDCPWWQSEEPAAREAWDELYASTARPQPKPGDFLLADVAGTAGQYFVYRLTNPATWEGLYIGQASSQLAAIAIARHEDDQRIWLRESLESVSLLRERGQH